jgi:hypothetical protein
MPFLTGPRFIENPDQLQLYRPFCRLHPPPPVRPSVPPRADVVAVEPSTAAAVSRPADDRDRSGDLAVAAPEAERVGGVSLQLDIGIEPRRSFWWRLALSLVVRRLGR